MEREVRKTPKMGELRDLRPASVAMSGILLLGCAGDTIPPDPEGDTPLRTSETEFVLTRDGDSLQGEIPFTYTNRTGAVVSAVNCHGQAPPVLEKRVEGEWVLAWAPVVLQCLSPPIDVAPGETREDTLRIHAGLPSSGIQPVFEVDEVEGTYRLVWTNVVHDYDEDRQGFGDPLPLEDRVSNAFVIRVE